MDPIRLERDALPPFLLARREFLKSVGAGALALPGSIMASKGVAGPFLRRTARDDGVTSPDHFVPVDKKLDPAWRKALFAQETPTVRRGEQRTACAMPVGGIGCGQLYVGGDGTLRTWEIFNRHVFTGWGAKNYELNVPPRVVDHGFEVTALAAGDGGTPLTRSLDEAAVPDVEFLGQHPVATITYPAKAAAGDERGFPIEARLEVFAPFIPGNAPDSTLPVTFFRLELTNRSARAQKVGLATWLANAAAPDSGGLLGGVRSTHVTAEGDLLLVEHRIDPSTREAIARDEGAPRPAIVLAEPFKVDRRFLNFKIGGVDPPGETRVNLVIDGKVVASATRRNQEALAWTCFDLRDHVGRQARLEIVDAGAAERDHVKVDPIELSDTPRIGNGGPLEEQPDFGQLGLVLFEPAQPLPGEGTPRFAQERTLDPGKSATFTSALVWHFPNARNPSGGHWYGARFKTWRELALYVAKERERLIDDTLAWRDAWYGGSLPCWLLERLHAPVANLQTGVTQVWKNGRFWAWEGVGCCEGTCTHVWNYEHATGRLFPELARSTRELQDLGEGFHDDGLVGYRGFDVYAADGQCGTVLKCWREHLMSADDAFLRRNWPKIRKVVKYLLKRDANDDGLLEDDQHNTYDIQFFGANTFVGSLYLAALRAAEEMGKLVGEPEFAARCRKVFESGRRLSVERLWNGEYFVQQVDLKAHPKEQYADGCLADQLFGQGWARQVGLGDLYPDELVKKALRSVWNYCWAPDVGPQTLRHLPERYFARAGEAGLFTCTWPKSKHLGENGVRYRDEIWSGIEYQVAGHMIWEGMVEEGLAILRGIDQRYDGRLHNPWNEIECGDHYARAMASFGCYLALLGFEHDGPAGRLGFAPRLQQDRFAAAFTSAGGWGTFRQTRTRGEQADGVLLQRGQLRLRELSFELPDDSTGWTASLSHVLAADRARPRDVVIELERAGRRATVSLASPLDLAAGDALHATFRTS